MRISARLFSTSNEMWPSERFLFSRIVPPVHPRFSNPIHHSFPLLNSLTSRIKIIQPLFWSHIGALAQFLQEQYREHLFTKEMHITGGKGRKIQAFPTLDNDKIMKIRYLFPHVEVSVSFFFVFSNFSVVKWNRGNSFSFHQGSINFNASSFLIK